MVLPAKGVNTNPITELLGIILIILSLINSYFELFIVIFLKPGESKQYTCLTFSLFSFLHYIAEYAAKLPPIE